MTAQVARRTKGNLLKELRERHKDSVERTRAQLKEQQAIRRQICQALRDGPKTILEIAKASDMPAHVILWHVTAMKKYDLVEEAGMCEEYYLYQQVKEAKK